MSYDLSRVNPFDLCFGIVGFGVLFTFSIMYCYKCITNRMIFKHRQIYPGGLDTENDIEIPRVTFQVDAEPETGQPDSIHVEAYKDNLIIKVPLRLWTF